jgi:tetratricopeptide (TPR) repeat protein
MADNTEYKEELNENTSQIINNYDVNKEEQEIDLKKYVTYIGVFVVVILIAVAGYYYNQSRIASQNEAAQKEFDKIEELMASEDYDKALNGGMTLGGKTIGLVALINNYGSTELAKTASLNAGYIYLEKNQNNKALEMFEKAIESESELVKMGANAGMGASYEAMKKNEDAARSYEIASSLTKEKVLTAKYKYFAAINYELAKNKEKAINLYKDLIFEDQYSEFSGLSKIALTKLGIEFE